MILLPVKALKPGMRLAQPVLHPRRDDYILLEKSYELVDDVIEALHDIGIEQFWVELPSLEIHDDRVHNRVLAHHEPLYRAMRTSLDCIRRRIAITLNVGLYRRSVEDQLFAVIADPAHESVIADLSDEAIDHAGHSANVAYLALLLGAHLTNHLRSQRRSLPSHIAEDTAPLGLGALLHDIGKTDIDPAMATKCILDPDARDVEYRAHTLAGYERVLGHVPGTAATVVLNHHQRYSGKGFPDRFNRLTKSTREPPSADRIHVFSRIVAVADVVDRLLAIGGHGGPPNHVALQALTDKRFDGWFDPVVVDALTRILPPYRVGTVVTLSSRQQAVVVATDYRHLYRPVVKLLTGSAYERGPHAVRGLVDLQRQPELDILFVEPDAAPQAALETVA